MFKFKKKNLIYTATCVFLILILASLIPRLRSTTINTLRYPLNLFSIIRRELQAIIFYHRNFIQNERLQKEIDLLKYKVNTLNEVYLQNLRLKDILSFKQRSHLKVIVASVIGRPTDSLSSVIIINKGSYSGIKQGFVAISHLGLVGRVVETSESTSKIMLINDTNLGVSAIVQRSRQEGLVTGTLGTHLIMRYLPKEADIEISDVIITSGLTDMYPKGLLIGTVVDLGEEFSGLSRYALIKPVVNLSNLEEVLIIIP